MAVVHNLSAYRLTGCLQQKRRAVKKVPPAIDEIVGDEFVARRAMREGQFDDGFTIPFDSLNPFPRPRASTPSPKRARAGGSVASPSRRSPRFFLEAREAALFAFELLALIGSIATVAGILLLVGAAQ